MQLTTNEHGKPFWINIKLSDGFSAELFHEVPKTRCEIEFSSEIGRDLDNAKAFHSNLGSLTVLDRMTGFSFGRDIESGYRDTKGRFWLASGMFDVSDSGCKTIGEAIQWVKDNANNCKGIK